MSLTIPINLKGTGNRISNSGNQGKGVNVKLPVLGITGNTSATRLRVAKTVAAAVAVVSPKESIELAEAAKEKPFLGYKDFDQATQDKLKRLFEKLTDDSIDVGDDDISDEIIVAARATGVDPKRVAEAVKQISSQKDAKSLTTAAIQWVVAVDTDLLLSAPQASIRESCYSLIPDDEKSTEELKERVSALEKRVAKLEQALPVGKQANT